VGLVRIKAPACKLTGFSNSER